MNGAILSKQLILIRGLPGSGKSTLANLLLSHYRDNNIASEAYEADQFFMDINGNYVFARHLLGDAHIQCQKKTKDALGEGKTVIVSNTFTTKSELKPYFDMIHEHGLNPTVYLMQSEYGSIHDVPEAVMANMRNRFQYDISDMYKEF